MIIYFGNILSKHGNTPTFIEALGPKLNEVYPTLISSDKKSKFWRMLDMIFFFLRYQKKAQLVLIDTYSTTNFWYAIVIGYMSLFWGIPYTPIIRGGNLEYRLKKFPLTSKLFFSNAFRIVSPSTFLVKTFQKHGYDVTYIPNFIEVNKYIFKKRDTIQPKLFWIRAFQDIYNPLLALEVFKKIMILYPNAKMKMVGPDKGLLTEVKKEILKNKFEDQISLSGKLSKIEWTTLAGDFDIFINTTNFDNRPVTVIEAMAIGIPVISTNAGGLPDLIESGVDGILVPVGDIESFVEAIDYIVSNPTYAINLTLNARNKVENYDWIIIKQQWQNLIQDAIQFNY